MYDRHVGNPSLEPIRWLHDVAAVERTASARCIFGAGKYPGLTGAVPIGACLGDNRSISPSFTAPIRAHAGIVDLKAVVVPALRSAPCSISQVRSVAK